MRLKYIKSERLTLIADTQSVKSRRLIYLAVTLITLPLLSLACNGNSIDKIKPNPYFPVLKKPAETIMLVSGGGELVCDDAGYLRVNRSSGYSDLIIWPYGYSLKVEGDDRWVINDKNEKVARVGDWIYLVGGEIPAWAVNELIGYSLPDDAKGPYWLVGDVILD